MGLFMYFYTTHFSTIDAGMDFRLWNITKPWGPDIDLAMYIDFGWLILYLLNLFSSLGNTKVFGMKLNSS